MTQLFTKVIEHSGKTLPEWKWNWIVSKTDQFRKMDVVAEGYAPCQKTALERAEAAMRMNR